MWVWRVLRFSVMVSKGFAWLHTGSQGFAWLRKASQGFRVAPTRGHTASQGFAWLHTGSQGRKASKGFARLYAGLRGSARMVWAQDYVWKYMWKMRRDVR
jgi:hypothetical protein